MFTKKNNFNVVGYVDIDTLRDNAEPREPSVLTQKATAVKDAVTDLADTTHTEMMARALVHGQRHQAKLRARQMAKSQVKALKKIGRKS